MSYSHRYMYVFTKNDNVIFLKTSIITIKQ